MRDVIIFAVAALVLAGCSAKTGSPTGSNAPVSSSGDFSMTLAFDPTPPKQGNETITIALKDSAGNPVKGAVVKIGTTMPQMSMSGPNLTAQDNGDGTYSAVTNMNYATHWVLDVTAVLAAKNAKAEFAMDLR